MAFSSRLKAHRHILTLETLRFIYEYMIDGSAAGAALRSGIPEKYASRQGQWLKKHPIVIRAMENELDPSDMRKLGAALANIDEQIEICKSLLSLEDA